MTILNSSWSPSHSFLSIYSEFVIVSILYATCCMRLSVSSSRSSLLFCMSLCKELILFYMLYREDWNRSCFSSDWLWTNSNRFLTFSYSSLELSFSLSWTVLIRLSFCCWKFLFWQARFSFTFFSINSHCFIWDPKSLSIF